MTKKYLLNIMALGTFFFASLASAQGDYGWRWDHATVGARFFAPNYNPYFSPSAADISQYTGLYFYNSTNQTMLPPYSGDVAFQEINMGDIGYLALSESYNVLGDPCSDPVSWTLTGYCNIILRSDHALISFNSYYPTSSSQKQHLVTHEFLHVLGVGHSSCDPAVGVMAPSTTECAPLFTTLQPGEANTLMSFY